MRALDLIMILFIVILGFSNNALAIEEITYSESNIIQLTHSTSDRDSSFNPIWSPDGKKIAFDKDLHIWVMNVDGTNIQNITVRHSVAELPSWSPDGKKIAYTAFDTNPPFQIWVMNSDGTDNLKLTDKEIEITKDDINDIKNYFESIKTITIAEAKEKEKNSADTFSKDIVNLKGMIKQLQKVDRGFLITMKDDTGEIPIFLPNEKVDIKIDQKFFVSGNLYYNGSFERGKIYDIFLGAETLFVYDNYDVKPFSISNDWPVWNQDGKRIAYTKRIDIEGIPKVIQIWVMGADGSNKEKLFTMLDNSGGLSIHEKSWSPDGNNILFEYNFDIWVINVKTKAVKQLTDNNNQGIVENSATWSPDGKRVTFAARKEDKNGTIVEDGIAIMNFDGTERKYILKDNNGKWQYISSLTWNPDGNKIAFSAWENGKSDIIIANFGESNTSQSKESNGFEVILAILGLGSVTYLLRKK